MLFSPDAHEALVEEPWSSQRAQTAIAAIAADAERAFDDGWAAHPQDLLEHEDPATRFRTVYDGGAGVVDALHRLARRGFVELQRDYVPYLERSLEAPSGFPDEDAERSLWMGQTGIRLVLQRLAPSRANLERLAELTAANERDERREVMWGSPGTILAGRELGLDVVATLAHLLDEELAGAGGELTWRAGPLRKGAGLCHGTAGNGYAFLALLERTGDERWLVRARAFAMHAAAQVERSRSESGRGRYTLWTGDLGATLYLADCIEGGGKPPLP